MNEARSNGLRLLRERVASLPDALRQLGAAENPRLDLGGLPVRRYWTSGIGSSEAHARFLAERLDYELGLWARFVPLSSLAKRPAQCALDVLVLFSQGLAPNVRPLLAAPANWRGAVLVTAARQRSESPDDAKGRLLKEFRADGGTVRTMPGENEYGTLVRVVGPMVGYLEALRIVAAIARARGVPHEPIDVALLCERVSVAQERLAHNLTEAGLVSLEGFEQGLAFLALGTYGELVTNLQYKVLEGMLLPLPPVWDLLGFAHGPFQQGFAGRMTLVALTHAGDALEQELLGRIRAMLDSRQHRLIVLDASLPGALAIFEHEAMLDALLLRFLAERGMEPSDWPGREADRPLYDADDWLGAHSPSPRPPRASVPTALRRLTWPELEALVRSGHTTAVLPLGSTEQHGPHLPFDTDTRVAEALADRLCALIPEAIRLPTIALGCSSEHLEFPGTLSLAPATLTAVLEDVARSLRGAGFHRMFVFSAHGGNLAALAEALPRLRDSAAPLTVDAFTDLARLSETLRRESAGLGVSAEASGHHAGELETSILLAIDRSVVRERQLVPGFVEPTDDPQALFYPSLRPHAANGTVGDPTRANPARGERYLEAWTGLLLAAYRGEKNEP